MPEYVVGFASNKWGQTALIRKNRPDWQAGLLNGIGGRVEQGETPDQAMVREFEEETGQLLHGWQKFVCMEFPDSRIHFYRIRNLTNEILDSLDDVTDEKIFLLDQGDTFKMQYNMIPNLRWLLPLSLYTDDDYEVIRVMSREVELLGGKEIL